MDLKKIIAGAGISFLAFFLIVTFVGYSTRKTAVGFSARDLEAEQYEIGDTVTKDLSVSTTKEIDDNYQDGDVLYLHGKWSLLRNKEEIDGGEKELSSGSYSHTLDMFFNTKGNYIFSVAIYSAESHYENGDWTDYSYQKEEEKVYPFTVGYPEPPEPVWSQAIEIFLDGLRSISEKVVGFNFS